ncbi:MAG: hypothetical protein IKL10_05890 [Clostridia bacterium]|nr:hypothetical protein [Clostridia bacterium]
MKKVIAIVLALVVVIGLVACATVAGNDETTTLADETTTAADVTVAATFVEAFKAEAAKEDATANTIATALSTNEVVAFMPMVQDMEEGYLAGFDADITGFASCTAFMPMIGTIPFVSYVFELAEDADADAFVTTLKDNANLRWNICTAAEEMLVETVGNFVFFIMAPLSFEQEPVGDELEGEVEGGDIGGMEGELDGPAAFDPDAETVADETVAEDTTAEETTVA